MRSAGLQLNFHAGSERSSANEPVTQNGKLGARLVAGHQLGTGAPIDLAHPVGPRPFGWLDVSLDTCPVELVDLSPLELPRQLEGRSSACGEDDGAGRRTIEPMRHSQVDKFSLGM